MVGKNQGNHPKHQGFFAPSERQKIPRKTEKNCWKHPKHQGFFAPSEPQKTPRKTETNCWKHSKHLGIALAGKDQGKSKHQGKEDQGMPVTLRNCWTHFAL